jgi:cytochrome c biogenesis protein CcmG, thiol:disulfide interchange protein DsbE
MKKIALLFVGLAFVTGSFAQDDTLSHEDATGKKIASVHLKDMDGNDMNTADLGFDGPVIISFWATWCSPCKAELNTIHEVYPDWQEETRKQKNLFPCMPMEKIGITSF